MYNSKLSLMETNNDYQNRLPEHPEPLELAAHEEGSSPIPPVAGTARPSAAVGRHDRHGGGFLGWAWLTVLAIAVMIGSIYWFSDRGQRDEDSLYAAARNNTNSSGDVEYVEFAEFQAEPSAARTAAPATTKTIARTDASAVPQDVVYLFPLNGSEIPDDATLNNLAKKVADTGAYVSVVAYTDESGNAAYNQRLSERRAKRVGDYLIAHGVPANHVKTKGMGQTHAYPSAAQDRRAEIHVNI